VASTSTVGTGRGATESEACAVARAELARQILGDPTWLDVVTLDLGREPPRARAEPAGGFTCEMALTGSDTAATLVEFEQAHPHVSAPEPWHDALYGFVAAHMARHACARRAALFEVECEEPPTEEADEALASVAAGVSLAPVYLGGVPTDAQGKLLRRPGVLVMFHGVPIGGVPLVISGGDGTEAQRLSTDERGVARVGRRGQLWERATAVVDAAALLGPLAHHWPPDAVVLQARPVDARRWAVVTSPGTPDDFARAVAERLTRAGLSREVKIDAQVRESLRTASPTDLPVLADLLGGRLDVVFATSVESRFAGRASGGRVWHEATAKVEARDAWTGRVLATVEVKAKATGSGDEDAAAAARRSVADPLVGKVLSNAAIPIPDELRPK
jgi:hypothetical protein